MALALHPIEQLLDQARLADAGFAPDQDAAGLSLLGALPRCLKLSPFVVTPDQALALFGLGRIRRVSAAPVTGAAEIATVLWPAKARRLTHAAKSKRRYGRRAMRPARSPRAA